MSQRKTLIKSFKWSSVGTIGMAVFQLLQIAILTRFLPKEAFGLVALAVLVVNFTNIFVEMGITSAILHVQKATRKEYSSLYWLGFFVALVLYSVILLSAGIVSQFYNEPQLVNIIRILGLNIIFITIGQQYRILLQKNMKFDVITKVSLFSCFIGLIVAVLLVFFDFGVYSLVYSTLISSLTASLFFLVICVKQYPIKFHFRLNETKKFLKIGVYGLGSNILDFFSREIDIIIIGKFLPPGSLGVYSLIKQISLKLYSVLMPIIFNVLNPFLASLNQQKEKMELTFLKIVYNVVNITFPFYLVLILAAQELITLMYGANYHDAYKVLIYLSIFQASFSIVKPLGSLQIATGKTDVGFYWTIFRNVFTMILFLFINWIGFNSIEDISLSLAVLSLFLIMLTWTLQVRRITSISFINYFKQFYKPLLLMIIISFIKIIVLDKYIIFSNYLINGLLKIVVGLLIYLTLIIISDKKQLMNNFNLILDGKNR